jgi:hypothetical protein
MAAMRRRRGARTLLPKSIRVAAMGRSYNGNRASRLARGVVACCNPAPMTTPTEKQQGETAARMAAGMTSRARRPSPHSAAG